MTNRPRLIGLTLGDSFDQLSRSGVNYNVFSRLSKGFDLTKVFDLDIGAISKLLLAVRYFSFDRTVWGNKLHQNPWAFIIRTNIAEKKLKELDGNYDLVFQDGAMFMPGWRPKVPFVSYHDSNVILSAKGKPYSQGAHYRGKNLCRTVEQEGRVYNGASLIFSMSDWLKRSLVDDFKVPEKKIVTVYAGTNLIVQDFKKDYDGKTIFFVGRNFERKGGKTLIEAFKLVRREIKDAHLIIVGPDNLHLNMDGVEIVGAIRDKDLLAQYFRKASVFVMPSFYEPFGIVFAEAFAYKNPCIGTNVCAMPEIIDNEKGGFVIPPGDYKALSDRIIMLLKDQRLSAEMGKYGFRKTKLIFNWDAVVDKMLSHCCLLY